MGLNNLTKNKQDARLKQDEKTVNEFLQDSQVKTAKKTSKQKYVRASYSLTSDLKDMVLKLSKQVSVKCSESDIIKIAIQEISKQSIGSIEEKIKKLREDKI